MEEKAHKIADVLEAPRKLSKLQKMWEAFVHPVPVERQTNRRISWSRLSEDMKSTRQMYGSHAHNCGATIGVMPRCDFACQGCYLGEEANQIPALPVEEIKKQLRLLRPALGPQGNLQLTDGEVTLRPENELLELLKYAKELGLVPMLMTHGDSFRRKPGLLERLMEAGLTEVSIHVDTDMRGRKGDAYKRATREAELNPLREEFAELIREAKRKTGLKIAVATTMTITEHNLVGVPDVIRWLTNNTDVFKMISFQPIAQVGRTEEGLGGGASVEDLWTKISEGLYEEQRHRDYLVNSSYWLGHQDCNRYTLGSVLQRPGKSGHFEPFFRFDVPGDEVFVNDLRAHFGGINLRNDSLAEVVARVLGCFKQDPKTVLSVLPFALEHIKRHDPENRVKVLLELARGQATLSGLNIVSHHFMSREEIKTQRGQERLSMCVFKVAVGDKLVSMCETNATNVREEFYKEIATKFPKKKGSDAPAPAATPAE
jgi:7,8-dihydro-6-hydroxymethylpterin dimethyltransferase